MCSSHRPAPLWRPWWSRMLQTARRRQSMLCATCMHMYMHMPMPTARRRQSMLCGRHLDDGRRACMHARTCMHSYVRVGAAADISKTGKLCSATQGPPCTPPRHRWSQFLANAMANATPTRGRTYTRGATRAGKPASTTSAWNTKAVTWWPAAGQAAASSSGARRGHSTIS